MKIAPVPASLVLTKGESLVIKDSQVTLGLGWDFTDKPIDLDASVVCFDAGFTSKGVCFFGKKKIFDGAIVHSGDNRDGAAAGDDESILINLEKIPEDVAYVTTIINSYDGEPFSKIKNAYARLLNEQKVETHKYNVADAGDHIGFIMCTIYRNLAGAGEWRLRSHGLRASGNTYKKCLPEITGALMQVYSS